VQDYSQALSLDPGNAKARAGLDRAHAAFGQDSYAKAVGTGFAALGAGRLDEARAAFEKARDIRPGGAEAQTGLQRVGAALSARGYASTRQRAAALEAEERWTEAFNEYDAALKVDPSLVFAQQGRARAASRADLSSALQNLIDHPERLAAKAVRAEAESLVRRAAGADPSGPVLRSQIARLQILLPEFDVPVRLELVSDNATQVQIQRVGTFGTFSKREIELKPGKYTVVGTRPGFRDVRRDVTIAPGRDVQTISVSCVEPI
jgi:eukaryotic-like serine/threonine-protein kinase